MSQFCSDSPTCHNLVKNALSYLPVYRMLHPSPPTALTVPPEGSLGCKETRSVAKATERNKLRACPWHRLVSQGGKRPHLHSRLTCIAILGSEKSEFPSSHNVRQTLEFWPILSIKFMLHPYFSIPSSPMLDVILAISDAANEFCRWDFMKPSCKSCFNFI